MDELGWPFLIGAGGMLALGLARRWYRYRTAAKLADRLLEDVVKGKDAFRR